MQAQIKITTEIRVPYLQMGCQHHNHTVSVDIIQYLLTSFQVSFGKQADMWLARNHSNKWLC